MFPEWIITTIHAAMSSGHVRWSDTALHQDSELCSTSFHLKSTTRRAQCGIPDLRHMYYYPRPPTAPQTLLQRPQRLSYSGIRNIQCHPNTDLWQAQFSIPAVAGTILQCGAVCRGNGLTQFLNKICEPWFKADVSGLWFWAETVY